MATVVCQRVYWPHSWEGLMPIWPMWNLAFFFIFLFFVLLVFCLFLLFCMFVGFDLFFDLIWFDSIWFDLRERKKEHKLGWVGRWEHLGEGEWTLRRVVWKEFEIQFQLRGKTCMGGYASVCWYVHRSTYTDSSIVDVHTCVHTHLHIRYALQPFQFPKRSIGNNRQQKPDRWTLTSW